MAKDTEKWISVNDELPEFNKQVLVLYHPSSPQMDGKLHYGIDKRYHLPENELPNGGNRRLIENKNFLNRVEFWQPLPHPPKQ